MRARLTNPAKVLFPDPGVTKRQLADYWEAVAEHALPLLANRPLMLHRCPDGYARQCFFQKHVGTGVPEAVGRVTVNAHEQPYGFVDGLPALLALVQIDVLELHVWGSRIERLEEPDLVVLDLDPAEGLAWREVVDAALLLRARLAASGLTSFVRLTGGKGLHVVAPLLPGARWSALKEFVRAIVDELVAAEPQRFTASASRARRTGKIFVDYLRNERGATAIASYSPRARAGAPIALPIAWEDLDRSARAPPRYGLRDVPRLVRRRRDPWAELERSRRAL
jgi:bifunctional non-homologous end joining protein LigD